VSWAAVMTGQVARLRPHTKVQKSPDLALLQLAAGAIGVTVASVWEAVARSVRPGQQRLGPHFDRLA
jgi:D-serine deaminase-like pyridoxal phosphate-dependent protein